MILTAIFSALIGVINWLVGLLPGVTFPSLTAPLAAISDSRIWQYLAWANWYIPIDLALSLFAARVAFGLAMFGWEFISWAATKLHILGGSS